MTIVNCIDVSLSLACFYNNKTIVNVDCNNVQWVNNSMQSAFTYCDNLRSVSNINRMITNMEGSFYCCSNLVNAPVIPNSVTNMGSTFFYCISLVNAPVIPNSVTDMSRTFDGCSNLINTPIIPNSVTNMHGTFDGCSNLINTPIIPSNVTDMSYTFFICRNITNAPVIPNLVTNMSGTFYGCTNITNAPIIPSNVTDMSSTFSGCANITNAPVIPSNVTDMRFTFSECANITNAPDIPSNVTNMGYIFSNCINLTSVPNIPNSVVNVSSAFRYCNKITGNIYIKSEIIYDASNFANNTTLTKNVYIPFKASKPYSQVLYAWNCVDTSEEDNRCTVYTRINLLELSNENIYYPLFNSDGTPFGSIYGDNEAEYSSYSKTIYFSDTYDDHYFEGVADYANNVTLRVNIGDNTQTYNAFIKAGYGTYEYLHGVHLKDIDGSMITINATPNTATVLMLNETSGKTVDEDALNKFTYTNTNNDILINGLNTADTSIVVPTLWKETSSMRGLDGEIIDYKVSKEGYYDASGSVTINDSETINVNLEQIMCEYTIEPMPRDATVVLTADGYTQSGNTITVPYGTEVSYTISKAHYGTITGTDTPKTSTRKFIQLPIDQHTFTINATPNDAEVQMMIDGKLVNQNDNNWIIYANNLNGDIELQEYIGSNTDIVMPTTFTTNNTVTADYGSEITWKVSKDMHADKTDTLTLEDDTEINVNLGDSVNIDDYTYTVNNDVLTLTKYNGNGGDIEAPQIEEEE